MPSLSPTMEVGSILKWNKREGERFEGGEAICEVETDKATVTYEATDGGFIAKILIGSGEIKVGQPMLITVEEASDVAAFINYATPACTPAAIQSTPAPAASSTVAAVSAAPPVVAAVTSAGGRVVASPYAKTLARENGISVASIVGSGPGGRVISDDVLAAIAKGPSAVVTNTHAPAPIAAPTAPVSSTPVVSSGGTHTDFSLSPIQDALGGLFAASKRSVPHYHLSVELNLTKAQALCDNFNANADKKNTRASLLSIDDVLIKASALAMKKVPVANASWMDSFVRCYDRVDVNLFTGAGTSISAPILKDVGKLGLRDIANAKAQLTSPQSLVAGTFSIHNLGSYGVRSAAAIVLPPQSCALAFGAVQNTVVPRSVKTADEANWTVAPVMIATLACDHRVVDGAVGAEWLAVFKSYVEDPISMLL